MNDKSRRTRARLGFTLIELVVVIGILGILSLIVVAAVVRVRDAAAQLESKNNMRQLALAVHHFADSHRGRLPLVPQSWQIGNTAFPTPHEPSLFIRILPYLEQGNVRRGPGSFPVVPIFLSPADPTAWEGAGAGLSSYAANAEVFMNDRYRPPQYP